jgi:molybdate transport system substrate-binding protein
MNRTLAALLLLALGGAASAQAGARRSLSVAAAANLKPVIEVVQREFQRTHPDVGVSVTLGASGTFFAQLRSGAPFDVFLSADRDYPRKLVEAGLAGPGGEVVYAIGTLVVWTPRGSPIALEGKGLAALAGPGVKRLAVANPAVAPWGRAAMAALRGAGILDAVADRLVFGQSVSQAAQFASTGAADAALVPRSLTFAPELAGGRIFPVPQALYPLQEQSAVVVAGRENAALGQAFLSFLTGPKGRAILARYGYALP